MQRVEKTVFISYRRTNAPWALAVYQHLTHHGYDVFFDYLSIASGDFERVLLESIKARAHFVVLLTPKDLEHCTEPGDWLRREIETALETQRNIVPLMLEGFDFATPAIAQHLTGQLAALKRYNSLRVHVEYFEEAMARLREKYLNVPLTAVLHPLSSSAKQVVKTQQAAANAAPVATPNPQPSTTPVTAPKPEAPKAPPLDSVAIQKLSTHWQEFTNNVRSQCGVQVEAALRAVRDIAMSEQAVAFAFGSNEFSRRMVARPETLPKVANILSSILERTITLECQIGDQAQLPCNEPKAPPEPPLDSAAIQKLNTHWREFMNTVRSQCGVQVEAALRAVRDIAMSEQAVAFAFGSNEFSRRTVARPETLPKVANILSSILGHAITLECQVGDHAQLAGMVDIKTDGQQGDGLDPIVA